MRRGFTLFELMLVAAIIAILAASSAPFLARTVSWFYEVTTSETAINQLYDTGSVVSRALTQDQSLLASFTVSANTLSFDGKVIQSGVNANWTTRNDLGGVIVFNISTAAAASETLRFVVLPIR
jgi:prepilin-type N-terminal cleavage/methylation domain-containing protein